MELVENGARPSVFYMDAAYIAGVGIEHAVPMVYLFSFELLDFRGYIMMHEAGQVL